MAHHATESGTRVEGVAVAARARWFASALVVAVAAIASPCAAQCRYEVTDVIRRTGISVRAINEPGQVAGFHQLPFGPRIAYRWEVVIVDLPMPPGTRDAEAIDLDDEGAVVGCLAIPDDDLGDIAFLFDGAETRTLGMLPGHNWSEALAINEDGVIVGFSMHNVTGPVSAAAWIDEEIVDLTPQFKDTPWSQARDINDRGQVVGRRAPADRVSEWRAFLLDLETGRVTDVGVMPGGTTGDAKAVNNRGQVVAEGKHTDSGQFRSFIWSAGSSTDLGVLPEKTDTRVADINDRGLVVGHCTDSGVRPSAFLWFDGCLYDLNDLAMADDFVLTFASSIARDGRIACKAEEGPGRDAAVVLLAPIDPPAGDVTGDCLVDIRDILVVLAEWGECDLCIADLDGDGVVDVADILLILMSWS